MIDGFEARLTDLIADRLAGTTEIVSVARMRDGFPDAALTAPSAGVMVLSADPDTELGDDKLEVLGGRGERAERPVLRLAGEVLVRLEVRAAASLSERAAMVQALDRLLLELHDPAVRNGRAFDTGQDLGFSLDGGFRLARVVTASSAVVSADHRRFDVVYAYAGRFWPVETPTGPSITNVRARAAVLPMPIPSGLSTQAGAGALPIDVPIDLRASGGAIPDLAARLQGAAPPGALQGTTAGLPPGFVRVPVIDGAARLSYLPPATLETRVEVGIEIRYAGVESSFPVLARLPVEVTP